MTSRRGHDPRNFSLLVGWTKGLGTGLISVFFVLAMPQNRFLLTLAAVTTILDVAYVFVLRRRLREAR